MQPSGLPQRAKVQAQSFPKRGERGKTNQEAKQGRELNWEAGSRVKSNPGKEEAWTEVGLGRPGPDKRCQIQRRKGNI